MLTPESNKYNYIDKHAGRSYIHIHEYHTYLNTGTLEHGSSNTRSCPDTFCRREHVNKSTRQYLIDSILLFNRDFKINKTCPFQHKQCKKSNRYRKKCKYRYFFE